MIWKLKSGQSSNETHRLGCCKVATRGFHKFEFVFELVITAYGTL